MTDPSQAWLRKFVQFVDLFLQTRNAFTQVIPTISKVVRAVESPDVARQGQVYHRGPRGVHGWKRKFWPVKSGEDRNSVHFRNAYSAPTALCVLYVRPFWNKLHHRLVLIWQTSDATRTVPVPPARGSRGWYGCLTQASNDRRGFENRHVAHASP